MHGSAPLLVRCAILGAMLIVLRRKSKRSATALPQPVPFSAKATPCSVCRVPQDTPLAFHDIMNMTSATFVYTCPRMHAQCTSAPC